MDAQKWDGIRKMMSTRPRLPPEPIVVVDIEGNGQVPPDLIEIAIVSLISTGDSIESTYSTMIKPPRPITERVREIHGIGNMDVKECPQWLDIQSEVERRLTGAWFVAHNASLDLEVLRSHLPNWMPVGVIDTLRLARFVFPNAASHSLRALVELTRVMGDSKWIPHRAEDDAIATARLFTFLRLKSNVESWAEICKIAMLSTTTKDTGPSPDQGCLW